MKIERGTDFSDATASELCVCHFGGSSKSAQTTSNTDARVVGGEQSSNLSASNIKADRSGTINISTIDAGAVQGSLALALAGVEGANRNAREATAASGGILEGALRMSGEQQQQFTDAVENIKTSDVRTLVVVGVAVVGLAAVQLFRKG